MQGRIGIIEWASKFAWGLIRTAKENNEQEPIHYVADPWLHTMLLAGYLVGYYDIDLEEIFRELRFRQRYNIM